MNPIQSMTHLAYILDTKSIIIIAVVVTALLAMILTVTVTLLSVLGYLKWRKVRKTNEQSTAADLVTTNSVYYDEPEDFIPPDPSTEVNVAYGQVQDIST